MFNFVAVFQNSENMIMFTKKAAMLAAAFFYTKYNLVIFTRNACC